ncbi:facilitated trehalose transporter Tret1 [Manduca sexta]|uniref:facilitated trehalose transporter Tret1 n=1 Tax=Manduca sexta TaxID=7130 RepID=UPI00188DFCF6|nr:facilitated trehalose transporter Tret1 [Manduca sexta]XP_030026280.2 facilitated trehalose transporter Tret1 [Manduca sexta]XP_037296885.1 facilitated trehalose transporter Tret1 [Manduca sexta]
MESDEFDRITNNDKVENTENRAKHVSRPFLRQLFVSSGVWSIYFVLGLGFGAPTVMIPQIRREANSTDAVTENMESWLSSVHGYSALPWVFIIPILTRYVGRKLPFLLVCLNTLVGFILFYFSTNTTHLLISAIMLGMLLASNMTLLVVIVTEYSSPRYRGIFMIFESTLFFWGVWIANATGAFSHWKNIGILAFVCSLYPLTVVFWPESPYWLAMKGRFEECAISHHWLKGYDKDSEYELETLIDSQKAYLRMCADRTRTDCRSRFKQAMETVRTKAFYMPMFISISVMSLYHFSGKLVCSMYAVDLMQKITGSEETANIGMLIMDSVTIIGMQVGCALSKFLKRRTLLLSSAILGIIFLFIISIYLYLVKFSLISENKYLSILLLTLFSVSISIGPMIMPSTIFGELICLRYQTECLLLLTLFSEFLMATILKVSPYIFRALSLSGAFLFYGISASIFFFIVYKYLPETKDKTLFEIEHFFKDPSEPNGAVQSLIKRK